MNKTFIFSILTLFILANTVYSLPAMPILPDRFFGTVLQDGNNISLGTQITANVAGVYDTPYTMTQDGYYDLSVKIGDYGDAIEFYINGNLFGTASRNGGTKTNLDLTYTSPPVIEDPITPPPVTRGDGGGSITPTATEDNEIIEYYDVSITADSFISILSGNSSEMDITITNTGNDTLNDVIISVFGEVPSSWLTVTPKIISTLEPKAEQIVKLSFDIPIGFKGVYNFNVKVSNNDIDDSVTSLLVIKDSKVTYAKNIEIIDVNSETPIESGKSSKVEVTLKNTGLDIEYALLELTNIDDWLVIPESEYVVLEPGMETTIIFEVTAPINAKSNINDIMASVIGLPDAKKGTTIEIQQTTTEEVVTPKTPTGFSITNKSSAIGASILIVLILSVYLFFRKKQTLVNK